MTLWVIGEGRYKTKSFPEATLDWTDLAWKGREGRSNLSELVAGALAQQGGRAWLTEAAMTDTASYTSRNPRLDEAYLGTCAGLGPHEVPCDPSALPAGPDGGTSTDGGKDDAGADAGSDGGVCMKTVSGCEGFDDLDVAMRGLHAGSMWITRLRADLPFAALATDLVLEAAPSQVALSPEHEAKTFDDPTFDPCTSSRSLSPLTTNGVSAQDERSGGPTCRTATHRTGSTWFLVGLTALAVARVLDRARARERFAKQRDRR
jgi:hypothetical protein